MEVKAFTLVELIVVIAILAILGTLGFISFQGYSVSARDSVRIGDVRVIEKGLTLEQAKGNSLPLPDDKIDITVSGSLVSHQGYAGVGMLANLRQAGDIVDPLLKEPYTYMVTSPRKNFQLLAFMEKVHSSTYPFVAHAYASSYTDLFPKVFGESLGILLDANDLSPLQKKIIPDNELEIFSNSHLYTSYISDTQNITGTGGKLISGAVSQIVQAQDLLGSCQEIYETYPMSHNVDGNYVIDLDGSPLEVYCDMTTDGGGWIVLIKAQKGKIDYLSSGEIGVIEDALLQDEDTYKISDTNIKKIWNQNSIFRIEIFDDTYNVEDFVYIKISSIDRWNMPIRSHNWNISMLGSQTMEGLQNEIYKNPINLDGKCSSAFGPNKGGTACQNAVNMGYRGCSPRGFGVGAKCSDNGTWSRERHGRLLMR